jgi:hypothetical protein
MWPLIHLSLFPRDKLALGIIGCILIAILYLTGAVASFSLFLGARWAAKAVGSIAVLSIILVLVASSLFGTISVQRSIFIIFALVSAVLLFLPRHETVP